MAAQPAWGLPIIYPTVPGCVNGIISRDPRILQCQECGVTASAETLGLSGRGGPGYVHILSDLKFHSTMWTTGQTDNPRLCRTCRLGRGCECHRCREERRGA